LSAYLLTAELKPVDGVADWQIRINHPIKSF